MAGQQRGRHLALLDSTRPDLRGWEWRYVHRLCHSDLLTLKGHTSARRCGVVQPGRVADRHRELRQDGEGLGRQKWCRGPHPQGAHRPVFSASFSPDGSRIVTASYDKTAKVWDAKSGAEILTLKGHTDYVHSASFSPDGSRIVTASGDKTAKVWDAEDRRRGPHPQGAHRRASFRRRSARTARGSSPRVGDKTAKVWDARVVPRSSRSRGTPICVNSASFSPDGSRIVTGSYDKTAKVWDAQTGAEILTLKGHTDTVQSASFSPDGSRIVTASWDKTAKVWDARTGAELLTLKGHTDSVGRRRSARTGRGSSPGVMTRRRRSGTRQSGVPRSSHSRGTRIPSFGVVQPGRVADRHRE